MIDEPDLFDDCEIDEILAITLDLEGQEGLKALLNTTDLDKEDLIHSASKMEKAGLIDGAKIVREAAARAADPHALKIAAIMADEDTTKRKARFAEAYRGGHVSIEALEEAGLDDDTLDFIERSKKIQTFRR